MKKLRFDFLCLAVLVLSSAIIFYRVFSGMVPVPSDALVGLYHPWRDYFAGSYPRGMPFRNFLTTDPVRQQIPWRKTAIDAWKSGAIPGWNPYNGGGMPLSANIQAGVWYPLNVLFFMFPFPVAWTMLVVLQPIFSSVFMYLFLRGKDLSPPSSLYGSLVWAFSGFAVSWMTWGTIIHAALWLPLALLAVDRIFRNTVAKGRIYPWAILLVLSLAMSVLAGHIQIAFYTYLTVLAYAVCVWKKKYPSLPAAVITASSFLFSIVLTFVQWWPTVRFAAGSVRSSDNAVWNTEGWFLPWQHLIQYMVPDFFGNPATMNYWGIWNYGEFIGYIGGIAVFLALVGLSRMKKEAAFFSAVLLVSLIMATPNPVAELVYRMKLPMFSAMQPTRLTYLIVFSLAVLAAYGIDQLEKIRYRSYWLMFFAISAIYMLFWIFVRFASVTGTGWITAEQLGIARRNLVLPTAVFFVTGGLIGLRFAVRNARIAAMATFLVIGITFADLTRAGWKFIPGTPLGLFFPVTGTIDFLKHREGLFRVASVDPTLAPPDALAYYGIESLDLYDPVYGKRYGEYVSVLNGRRINGSHQFERIVSVGNPRSPLLDYANVEYILALGDIDAPNLEKVFTEGETRVYRNLSANPRFYFADSVKLAASGEEALSILSRSSVKGLAVLENGAASGNIGVSGGSISVLRYEPNLIEIRYRSAERGLMVHAAAYDPGWEARIDGKRTEIIRVNYLFSGITTPPGDHSVEFRYNSLRLARGGSRS